MKKLILTSVSILLVVTIAVVSVVFTTSAQETTYYFSDGFIYSVYGSNKAAIHAYVGEDSDITVPEYFDNARVERIEALAFYGVTADRIRLPNSIKYIGDEAFYNCSISSIVLPESIEEFGTAVFRYCTNLSVVVFMGDRQSLGEYMFYGCTSLKIIDLPDKLYRIPKGLLAYCKSLETIDIPDSTVIIDEYAFYASGLKNVTIPRDTDRIYDKAFAYCGGIKNISLMDDRFDFVSENAFEGCPVSFPYDIITYPTEEATTEYIYPTYIPIPPGSIPGDICPTDSTDPAETTSDTTVAGPTVSADDLVTIYFIDRRNWGEVFVYYWGEEGETSWPGIQMMYFMENEFGEDIYTITIPSDVDGLFFDAGTDDIRTERITYDIVDNDIFYCSGKQNEKGWWIVERSSYTGSTDPAETTVETTVTDVVTMPTPPKATCITTPGEDSTPPVMDYVPGEEFFFGMESGGIEDFERNEILNNSAAKDAVEKNREHLADIAYNVLKIGDADTDGKVTVADATKIQKFCAGFFDEDAEGYDKKCADVDTDGKVSIKDATKIQKYLAKLITSLL